MRLGIFNELMQSVMCMYPVARGGTADEQGAFCLAAALLCHRGEGLLHRASATHLCWQGCKACTSAPATSLDLVLRRRKQTALLRKTPTQGGAEGTTSCPNVSASCPRARRPRRAQPGSLGPLSDASSPPTPPRPCQPPHPPSQGKSVEHL